MRYFGDGVVLGSRQFVEEVFQRHRDQFGARRKTGARLPRHGDRMLVSGRVPIGNSHGPYYRDGLEYWTLLRTEHPTLLDEWAASRHQANLRRIAAWARPDLCPIEFIDSDIAYKNGLLISPAYLRSVGWFRRLAELVDCCHSVGLKAIFHSDGDLRTVLRELVATGIDGLNPIETAGRMVVGEIHEAFPNLVLVGGLDNHTLIHGNPDQVRGNPPLPEDRGKSTDLWLFHGRV